MIKKHGKLGNRLHARIFSYLPRGGAGNHNDAPAREPTCLLATEITTGSFIDNGIKSYDYRREFAYQYTDENSLTEITGRLSYFYPDGTTSETSYFLHDEFKDGFLIRREQNRGKSTTYEEYTYKNGRLVERAYRDETRRYSDYYEYDGDGNLVLQSTSYNSTFTEFAYSNGVASEIGYVDADGSKRTVTLSYNEKQQLVKSIEVRDTETTERRFSYTPEGLLAREERYDNNIPRYATTFEYDNHTNPQARQQTLPKGFPRTPTPDPVIITTRNYTKITYFAPAADGTDWIESASTRFDYDYNGHGFPTQRSSQDFDSDGAESSAENITYTYVKCP